MEQPERRDLVIGLNYFGKFDLGIKGIPSTIPTTEPEENNSDLVMESPVDDSNLVDGFSANELSTLVQKSLNKSQKLPCRIDVTIHWQFYE